MIEGTKIGNRSIHSVKCLIIKIYEIFVIFLILNNTMPNVFLYDNDFDNSST